MDLFLLVLCVYFLFWVFACVFARIFISKELAESLSKFGEILSYALVFFGFVMLSIFTTAWYVAFYFGFVENAAWWVN